ncbi:MAG TPA: hypothetical protein VIK31_07750 [Propionibacteriaceae bacterium]
MVLAALDVTVEALRQRVGDSLVALDIWESGSALSLAGFGMTPATGPMLHRVTEDLRQTATLAGSSLDDYHVLTVTGGVVVVVTRAHLSGALLLSADADLGWVLTDVIPQVRAALDAASV